MVAEAEPPKKDLTRGGIDFNEKLLHLYTRGEGTKYGPQWEQQLQAFPVDGVRFEILRMAPIVNLPLTLGLNN